MAVPIRLLMVEDDPGDARLIAEALADSELVDFELHVVDRLGACMAQLERESFDAILLDLGLPDSQGMATLARVASGAGGAPILVLTGVDDELMALKAVQAGAQDYLVKGQIFGTMLGRSIRHAMERAQALRASEDRFLQLVARIPQVFWLLDVKSRQVLFLSPSFETVTGLSAEIVLADPCAFLEIVHPEDRDRLASGFAGSFSDDLEMEFRVLPPDGSLRWLRCRGYPVEATEGEAAGARVAGLLEDITGVRRTDDRIRFQASLLAAVGQSVIATDLEGRITYWNRAAEQMFGWSADEVKGRLIEEVTVPATSLEHADEILEAVRSGQTWTGEFDVRRRDGTAFPALVTDSPILDATGRQVGIVGVSTDLTRMRRAERDLQRSEETYRGLFESMAEGAVYLDAEGRVLDSNPAAERILGIGVDRLRGRSLLEFSWGAVREDGSELPPEEFPALVALRTGREVDGVVMGIQEPTAGRRRWLLVNARPRFRQGEAKFVQVYITLTDITALREIDEARRDSEERLNRILETVTEAIVIIGSSGRIVFANPAAEAVLGLSRSGILTRRYDDPAWQIASVDGGSFPADELPAARVFSTRAPVYRIEHAIVWPDGHRAILSIDAAPLVGATGVLEGVVATIRDVTDAKETADRLRFQATLLDAVGEAVAATDRDGRIVHWNRHAEQTSGWLAAEVSDRPLSDVVAGPENAEAVRRLMDQVLAGEGWRGELSLIRRDGSTYPAFVSGAPIRNEPGQIIGMVGAASDLTEIRRLEEQLQQAQRMEAVGRLAGGVAHDFNNMLTSILGNSDLILGRLAEDDPMAAEVREIRKASERAARLTRQLLAFSRKQVLMPQVLDMEALVEGMQTMIGRLIGEDLELVFERDPELGRVRADPGQMEQVVLNLVVNARDAMPDGGRLAVELRNVDGSGSEPDGGPAVLLRVRDTGQGILPEVLPHIFEPFFTTKPTGQGTGLGLSTVYGIVTQSGGRIEVSSRPGEGTTFEVFLPRVVELPEPPTIAPSAGATKGTETILLVEDDEALRALGARVLRALGYQVLVAADGPEALRLHEQHQAPVDLLLTDVVMPQMSGKELAERLSGRQPGLRVLYMSGYTYEIIARHGVLEEGQKFLEKPFPPARLAARVRDALDLQVAEST